MAIVNAPSTASPLIKSVAKIGCLFVRTCAVWKKFSSDDAVPEYITAALKHDEVEVRRNVTTSNWKFKRN